jgi:hypothetical protein
MKLRRFLPSRALFAGLCALGAWSVGARARAQESCDPDGGVPPDFGQLIETFPSQNALRVPRDGFVRFVYRGRVPPRPVLIVRDARERIIPGSVAIVGPEVHWTASAPLDGQQVYTATASDILGGDSEIRFTTGENLASFSTAPTFGGIVSASSERVGPGDICGDEEARAVTIGWRFARGSAWPQTELTYVVYETRGPGISGPIERARDRGRLSTTPCADNTDQCVSFRLSSANAAGPACFSVQVYDPQGRTVESRNERCLNLDAGNYFYGCAVGSVGSPRRAHPALLALPLALAVALRGRIARRTPPRSV